MRRVLSVAVLIAAMGSAAACGSVSPNEGEEAVLIRKPWVFGSGGIDPTPVKPGLAWVAITTEHRIVNMQPMQVSLQINDLMSLDGVPLDFEEKLKPAEPLITQEEITEFRKLLERAREYDKRNNEPDCELDEKRQAIKQIAEKLGVEISFL